MNRVQCDCHCPAAKTGERSVVQRACPVCGKPYSACSVCLADGRNLECDDCYRAALRTGGGQN